MRNRIFLSPVILALFAFPLTASGQLEVSPATYDFGNVEIGGSTTGMITVMNMGAQEELLEASLSGSPDFAITSAVPAAISPGQNIYIEITFSPSSAGCISAYLKINGATASELGGMGVSVEPPPSATVADILAFFDESVADGTLPGNGPGNSPDARRGALRNMIEAAGDLIEDGAFVQAGQQLLDAYQRCDGLSRPPDFVAGPAAPTLAGMILDLMAALG